MDFFDSIAQFLNENPNLYFALLFCFVLIVILKNFEDAGIGPIKVFDGLIKFIKIFSKLVVILLGIALLILIFIKLFSIFSTPVVVTITPTTIILFLIFYDLFGKK